MAAVDVIRCARCQTLGHSNKECKLPFFRKFTDAELRQQRLAKQATDKAEWEARQLVRAQQKAKYEEEKAARKAEWEANKQARWEAREAAKAERLAAKAVANDWWWTCKPAPAMEQTEETESTAASSAVDEDEVVRRATLNKEVRKLEKTLREVAKLEELDEAKLDVLQKEKLAKKQQFKNRRTAAWYLAKAVARFELRSQK